MRNAGVRTHRGPAFRTAALAAGVLATLGVCGAGFLLALRVFTGSSYIAGTVVDARTGAPLAGVAVAVSNRGWGVVNGQLVWDKDYVYPTVSDQQGRFRIAFDVGSSAHVKATKAGYQPHDSWYESNRVITITLQLSAPTVHLQLSTVPGAATTQGGFP
jgi:hypothetical protein